MSDQTQTNGTLDGDGETFPLGRGIYADFSHDNEMVAIYAALGLFRQGGFGLAEGGRTWFASRVLVNDQVQPLEFCGGEESEGICELGAFADSQSYARENGQGDWEACVENVLCIPVFIQVYCVSMSPRCHHASVHSTSLGSLYTSCLSSATVSLFRDHVAIQPPSVRSSRDAKARTW